MTQKCHAAKILNTISLKNIIAAAQAHDHVGLMALLRH
jgi:hypothetical protein